MGLTLAASLKVSELSCGYPDAIVLSGVNLRVERGMVVGLIGANGCGKSTLIRTVVGLLPPLAGSVEIQGSDASRLDARVRAGRLGYVPQAVRPAFPYRVDDFVLMGRAPHVATVGRPQPQDRAAVRRALEELGIDGLAGRPVTQLSGGQLQLVLIARALAQEPEVLVLDEPASSLDYGHQARLLKLIRRLAQRGMAVLMSTHHPDHALTACDEVVALAGGKVLKQGPPGDAITEETLQVIYGVPVAVAVVTLPSGESRRVVLPPAS